MTTDLKLPQSIERILIAAAADPELCEALLAHRLEAVEVRGHVLEPSERALLQAVPESQLRAVIEGLRGVAAQPVAGPAPFASQGIRPPAPVPPPPAGIRPDPPVPAGIRPDPPAPTGIRPDFPMAPPAGIRPDPPPPLQVAGIRPEGFTGIRPDDPVSRGIRPTRLLVGAALTAALGGGAYYLLTATHGNRPERPVAVQPAQGQGQTQTGEAPADAGGPDAAERGSDRDE